MIGNKKNESRLLCTEGPFFLDSALSEADTWTMSTDRDQLIDLDFADKFSADLKHCRGHQFLG
jgi:hypothetical protein